MIAPQHLDAYAKGLERIRQWVRFQRPAVPAEEFRRQLIAFRAGFRSDVANDTLTPVEIAEARGHLAATEEALRAIEAGAR